MRGFVYKLVCPVKKAPIYVGSTVKFPSTRLSEHISWINRDNDSPLYKYLRENKVIPDIEVLEKVEFDGDLNKLRKEEDKWIDNLFLQNVPLLNRQAASFQTPSRDVPIVDKPSKPKKEYTMVRMETGICEEVKKYVSETRQSVGGFFALAAIEKLQKDKK